MLNSLGILITIFITRPHIVTCSNSNCDTGPSPHIGVCYWHESTAVTWADAYKSCYDQAGRLAIISDTTTQTFLNTYMNSAESVDVWIGLSDGHTFGTFRWTNTRALADNYQPWETSPTGGTLKKCVYRKSGVQQWTPESCDATKQYICQSYDSGLPTYQCDTLANGCLGITPMEWTQESNCPDLSALDSDRKSEFTGVTSLDDCKSLCRQRVDFNCTHVKYSASADVCVMFSDLWGEAGGNPFSTSACNSDYIWHKGRAGRAEGLTCFDKTDTATYTLAAAQTQCQSVGGDIARIANRDEYDFLEYRRSQGDFLDYWWNGKTTDGNDYNFRYLDDTYPEFSIFGGHGSAHYGSVCARLHTNADQAPHTHAESCTNSKMALCEQTASGSCISDLNDNYITDDSTMTVTSSSDVSTGATTVTVMCNANLAFSGDNSQEKNFTCSCGFSSATYNAGYCSDFTCTLTPTPASLTCVPIQCAEPTLTSALVTTSNAPYDVGETVTFTCNNGLWINDTSLASPVTTMDATCNSNAGWDFQYQAQCTTVDCQQPTGANIANLNSVSTTYSGFSVTLNCDTGHWVTSGTFSQSVTCSVTGSWPAIQDCVAVDCGQPSGSHFDNLVSPNTQYSGSAVTLNCTTGHWVSSGVFTQDITCYNTGSWDSVTSCIVVDCGQPSGSNLDALVSPNTEYSGSPVTLNCTTGHWVSSGVFTQSITCSDTGAWDSVTSCSLVDCGQPSGSSLVALAPSDTQYSGSPVTLNCTTPGNWVSSGVFTQNITCLDTGLWDNVTSCTVVDCGQPSGSNLDALGSPDTQYSGSAVTLNCTTGHWVSSGVFTQSITCSNTGSWDNVTSCSSVDCGIPSGLMYSSIHSNTGNVYLDNTTYECITGHYFAGSNGNISTITCMADGDWSSIVDCIAKNCSTPPDIQNSDQSSTGTLYSNTTTYDCHTGYYLPGELTTGTITCLEDGAWEHIENCTIVSCGNPPVLTYSSKQSHSGNAYLDNATYECTTGHVFTWNNVTVGMITCMADGNWSSIDDCNAKNCSIPPDIPNSDQSSTGTLYSNTTTYDCHTGYYLPGRLTTDTITCSEDGTWGHIDNCTIVDCGNPPALNYSTIQSHMGNEYLDNVTYECATGHFFTGNNVTLNTITCISDGNWSSINDCTAADCNLPTDTPANSYIVNQTGDWYIDNITYACDTGYRYASGSITSLITCQANASWSQAEDCIIVDCGPAPVFDNTNIVITNDNASSCNFTTNTNSTLDNCTNSIDSQYNATLYTNKTTYVCDSYRFFSTGELSKVSECQANGNWSITEGCSEHYNITCVNDYNGTTYDFDTAKNTCLSQGLSMYKVTSENVQQALQTFIAENNVTRPWLGLEKVGSSWYWLDGTELENGLYNNWAPNQTNLTHDCAVVTHIAVAGMPIYAWLSTDCAESSYSLICTNDPDDECQTYLPHIHHTTKRTENGEVLYTCNENSSFADGTSNKSVSCGCGDDVKPLINEVLSWGSCTYPSVNVNEATTTQAPLETTNQSATPIAQTTTAPQVKTLRCPDPPALFNVDIVESITIAGGYVTYSCKLGYEFPDETAIRTIVCDDSANPTNWHVPFIDCRAKNCKTLDPEIETCTKISSSVDSRSPISSDIEESSSSISILAGEGLDCACSDSAEIFNTGIEESCLLCENQERWTPHPGQCGLNCPPLPSVEYSVVLDYYNYHTIGTEVMIKCNTGRRFIDGQATNTVQCNADRTWTEVGDCELDRCPTLTLPSNSTLNTTAVIFGTYVNVSCNLGYTYSPGSWYSVKECLDGGVWSNGSIPDCIEIECSGNQTVENAIQTGSDTSYGSVISYQCLDGYGLSGENPEDTYRTENGDLNTSVICQQDSRWSIQTLTCELGRCLSVPSYPLSSPDSSLAVNGSVVNITAVEGYMFIGEVNGKSITAECMTFKWNVPNVTVAAIECNPLPSIDHTSRNSSATDYQSVIMYTCNSGYSLLGNNTLTEIILQCSDNGWETLYPEEVIYIPTECAPVNCGIPPPLLHAYTPMNDNTTYGSQATYHAQTGYWHSRGEFLLTVECAHNGEWTPTPSNFTKITCPTLPIWAGMISNSNSTDVDTMVNATCGTNQQGDTLMLETQRVWIESLCSDTGDWYPPIPSCVVQNRAPAFSPPPSEADGADMIGIIAGLFIAAVVSAMLFIDSITIYEMYKTGQLFPGLLQLRGRLFPGSSQAQQHINFQGQVEIPQQNGWTEG